MDLKIFRGKFSFVSTVNLIDQFKTIIIVPRIEISIFFRRSENFSINFDMNFNINFLQKKNLNPSDYTCKL